MGFRLGINNTLGSMQNVSRRVNAQLDKVAGKVDKLLLRKSDHSPSVCNGTVVSPDGTKKAAGGKQTTGVGRITRSHTTEAALGMQMQRGRCTGTILCSPTSDDDKPQIKRSHSLDMCHVQGCRHR